MGIIDKIGRFFSGLGAIPSDILHAAEAAWKAIQTVWGFLFGSGSILDRAWDWLVNGAGWIGEQVEGFAGEVFGTLWHILTKVIPGAIAWVFDQAVHWAASVIRKVFNELKGLLNKAIKFLTGLAHKLVNALHGLVNKFIHWATAPIKWVLHWGAWLIRLITHPDRLAKWIAGAIIEPVVLWFLKAGAGVLVFLLRRESEVSTEFAHLLEDTLAKVL